jgi:branched-chain amino acid transport system ATP-binding protein
MTVPPLLTVTDLSIQFGGIKALDRACMEVAEGAVHGLIGPNGAGKTTLLNCISLIYKADAGTIRMKEKELNPHKPFEVVRLGISRTFQNIELFNNMTVMDNLLLGCHCKRRTGLFGDILFWGKAKAQEIAFREKVESVIDFLDLQPYRNKTIANIPYGVQKQVELGRALSMDPALLLLDEPSSGLNMEETQDLAFWIEDIKEDLGITVLLVEHDMRLVMDICDAVTALDYGRVLASGTPDEVVQDPAVVRAYLGEEEANGAA